MPTPFEQSVYDFLLTIPKGKVATYAQIAKSLGDPHFCRAVGNALHKNPEPDKYPCYKVVNSKGGLAENFALGIEEQKRRLENDGINVVDWKVDLEEWGM